MRENEEKKIREDDKKKMKRLTDRAYDLAVDKMNKASKDLF